MRILCNGEELELTASSSISFKKENLLFAFDKSSCERTQAFDIPATPRNERILGLAKLPEFYGEGMRRRFDAELQDGVVVKRGYLHVDSFQGGKYKAVFVTGENIGLLRIREAGGIKDFLITDAETTWGNAITSGDAFMTAPLWRSVMYEETYPNAIPFPSYSLTGIMDACFAQLGLRAPEYPNEVHTRALRVVPEKVGNVDFKTTIVSRPRANSGDGDYINDIAYPEQYFELAEFDIADGLQGECREFAGYDQFDIDTEVRYLEVAEEERPIIVRKMHALRARFDCDIHFDDNAPNIRMIGDGYRMTTFDISREYHGTAPAIGWQVEGSDNAMLTSVPTHERIQETPVVKYRDTWNVVQTGGTDIKTIRREEGVEYVAGKTIHLHKGQVFSFYDPEDIREKDGEAYRWSLGDEAFASIGWVYDGKSYFVDGQKPYDIVMTITTQEIEGEGDRVLLLPNLPSMSLVEACKVVAYMNGTLVGYSDADGVTFEDLRDIDGWRMMELDGKIIARSSVARKFGDYAARNVVRYDSSANVFGFETLETDYTIDSDNIEQKRDLYVIPYSEGGIGESEYVALRPALIRNADEQEADKPTIMQAAPDDTNLGRVSISRNEGLQRLCDASTAVEVTTRCTLAEFNAVTNKTILLMGGVRYVWTEAQWSKNTAKWKLNALK